MLRRTLLLSLAALRAFAQAPEASAQEPPLEFVSGTVAELPPGKIVVNRAVLGKPAENRTFQVNHETKIEGDLKVNARVTVGFKPTETGEPVAVRIIVRQTQRGSRQTPPAVWLPILL